MFTSVVRQHPDPTRHMAQRAALAPARRASHQKLMSPWDVDDDFLDGIDVIAPGFTNVDGRLPPPPGFMPTAYAPET